ncbi:MAG: 50S ribosomal protein L4 [Micropruina sp.]|nr:50S ribosomal protein L4 [Micropruina sp.]
MSESQTVTVLGTGSGTAELPASHFDAQTNVPLIHQVVVAQQAAARQGTAKTKTRAEVSGGGAKPWRQKGTGRARQGSRRAPQWTGGGVVHGPVPRSYAQRTPKKMIAAAIRGALSDRARNGRVHVVDAIVAGETPSTKSALQALTGIASNKILVVLHRDEDVAWLSLRNVAVVHAIAVDQLNAYDVLLNDDVVFTSAALQVYVGTPVAGVDDVILDEVEVEASEAVEASAPVKGSKNTYRGAEPPAGFEIKGNEDSMLFHTPESPWYAATIAEVWFKTEKAAEKAGFVNAVKKGEDSK